MNAIDPTKILSYGAIGLGFLLAFLSYRLLAKEQDRVEARSAMIRAIYSFMGFSFLLALLGFAGEFLKNVGPLGPRKPTVGVNAYLLEARPLKTVVGDAAASRSEIENIVANQFATNIQKKCFPVPPDREFHGTVTALVYKGSGGYANNVSIEDANFEKSAESCIFTLARGTAFPEPVGEGNPTEHQYWLSAKIVVLSNPK